jgi:hypothetical protein
MPTVKVEFWKYGTARTECKPYHLLESRVVEGRARNPLRAASLLADVSCRSAFKASIDTLRPCAGIPNNSHFSARPPHQFTPAWHEWIRSGTDIQPARPKTQKIEKRPLIHSDINTQTTNSYDFF